VTSVITKQLSLWSCHCCRSVYGCVAPAKLGINLLWQETEE